MSQLQLGLPWSLLRDASEALLLRWIRSLGLLFTERQPSPRLGVPFFLMWKSCCTLRAQPPATPRRRHRCRGSVLGIYQAGVRLSLSERRERTAAICNRTWQHVGSRPAPAVPCSVPAGGVQAPALVTNPCSARARNGNQQPWEPVLCSRLRPKLRLTPRPSSARFTRERALPRRPSRAAMLPR